MIKKLRRKVKRFHRKRPPVITNPKAHLQANYGREWTFLRANRVRQYRCLNMNLFSGQNHCSLAAVAALSRFYRDQGFVCFPAEDQEIYGFVYHYASQKKMYFKKIGTFTFFMGKMAKALWRRVGYFVHTKNYLYLIQEEKIQRLLMGEVDGQRPCIVSFTGGQYRRHSLILYGYLIYEKEGEEKVYYLVNDLWSDRPRFVDGTSLANPFVTMVQVLTLWP